jgi:ribosomal protein S12 methylthiotransferase
VRELLVVSQDTSAYGVDLKYRTDFWQGRPLKSNLGNLASALGELGVWIRLHYVYPYPHVDTLIPMMAAGTLLPYIDMPLQHGAPSVLARMKRPAATEKTLDRIAQWRDQCPELTIRSTFIVGYPGETEAEFEALLGFIDAAQLDRVGCFQYSAVEGAAANELPNPVPEAIKQARWEQFMALQQEISARKLRQKVGTTQSILIDTVTEDGSIGRTRADAPEIDGVVHLPGITEFRPGDLVEAEITSADDYDLWVS